MTDLRVMTFNVRGYYFPDGANVWEARKELAIATISRAAPDLIGLQEPQTGNLKAFDAALTRYHWTACFEYNNQPPHQWPAIFWDPARLRPYDSGGFWLSETPECWSASWETDCIRSAAWVKFRCGVVVPDTERAPIVHVNTHLDHISEHARVEGARLIVERLDALQADGCAAIVTGDFNASIGSPAYDVFRAAGFDDAYEAARDNDEHGDYTYHGWEGTSFRGSDAPPRRIDWILLRDGARTSLRSRASKIVRDHAAPVYPSDHYPVVADVAVSGL